MFLSQIETADLTGYRSRSCQKRWCAQNNVTFLVRGNGSLAILRQHVEEVLGSNTQKKNPNSEPNYSALK